MLRKNMGLHDQGGIDWVLDTGTGIDVSGALLQGKTATDTDLPILATAGGDFQPEEAQQVLIGATGELATVVQLPAGAPSALSVGKRCAQQGFEFWWKPFADAPIVRAPDGTALEVCVDNWVPYLPGQRLSAVEICVAATHIVQLRAGCRRIVHNSYPLKPGSRPYNQ